jgi:DNA-binding NarL/FixJ family response regulator
MNAKKIVLADSQLLTMEGLQCLLQQNEQLSTEVVFRTNSGKELLEFLAGASLDLLILDLQLDEKDGFEVLELLKKRQVDYKILVLTGESQAAVLRKLLGYQLDGVVRKQSPSSILTLALTHIFDGQKYFDPSLELTRIGKEASLKVGTSATQESIGNRFVQQFDITRRELEVLQLLATAHSNHEIGKLLYISEQTVTVHRKSLMRKLCVRNIAALIKIAYDNNLI